jgi:hypothetical protein
MRASTLCRAAAILALLLLCSVALAGGKKKKGRKKKSDDDVVDVSAWKDKWVVYTDGDGGYIFAVPNDMDSVFYGDGKTMYKERAFSSSGNPPKWDFRMWAPRVNNVADLYGTDDPNDTAGTLDCGTDEFELTRVDPKDAAKIIDKAVYKGPLWHRQAEKLFRDDKGTYYYVDRLRDEYGGKGYRFFSGQKGAMKELPLTNIVSDSKGQIFASKRGELRFVIEDEVEGTGKGTWIRGEAKTELTAVPVEDNLPLVYSELGVYEGSLGTPCDEY